MRPCLIFPAPTGISGSERLIHGIVREEELPMCVREALRASRAKQPDNEVTCIAFHTLDGGREVARTEPDASVLSSLHPKDVLVLSVTVTETTFENVHTVTHVLVARKHRRPVTGTSEI
jgi:hypothetical protein